MYCIISNIIYFYEIQTKKLASLGDLQKELFLNYFNCLNNWGN